MPPHSRALLAALTRPVPTPLPAGPAALLVLWHAQAETRRATGEDEALRANHVWHLTCRPALLTAFHATTVPDSLTNRLLALLDVMPVATEGFARAALVLSILNTNS